MPMLDASEHAFRAMYPTWARVYDARGRELKSVMACDPLTGEVVMVDLRPSFWDRLMRPLRARRLSWWRWLAYRSGLPTRHGFWPAPLRIVANDPPQVPPES
jgi:hypothetical protein